MQAFHHHHARRSWRDYLPLLVLIAVSALAAAALRQSGGRGWMDSFMGFFLTVFALLKLFNLSTFADGFQMYDLLAKHFRPYALLYPFLELALGLGYLAQWRVRSLSGATMLVLGFGALGVLRALYRGLDVNCACMGNILKVPLSTVALAEDLGMAAMALAMLVLT